MPKGHAGEEKAAFYLPANRRLTLWSRVLRRAALAHEKHRDFGEVHDLRRDGAEQQTTKPTPPQVKFV